ncbi:AbiH family protein [Liquorilactobacillus hordei]
MSIINKLFIIGNGFDLIHGISSTFNHFKEYFRYTYEYVYDEYTNL